jgi:3-oxoacyl-(acyl-carrier-protein) synthase
MSEPLFASFRKLGALDPRARLGEGAAFFVFETDEHARARGARTLAHAIGYGTAFDAPAGEAPLIHASPEAMQRAIESALADAQLTPDAIDAVASGVSGLGAFDAAETAAIQSVLGAHTRIYAPKAIFGETLGAAGAMGIAAALAWFEGAPPTPAVAPSRQAGTDAGDAARSMAQQPHTVLVTSMGYYGNASALVLRAP